MGSLLHGFSSSLTAFPTSTANKHNQTNHNKAYKQTCIRLKKTTSQPFFFHHSIFEKNTNLITQHLNSELSHSLCIFSFDEHLGHFFWGWEGPCSLNMDRSLKHLKKKRCI